MGKMESALIKDQVREFIMTIAVRRGVPKVADDDSRTSYRSQISCVFKHPGKRDLYIALADRWLPQLPDDMPNVYDIVAAMARGEAAPETSGDRSAMAAGLGENTSIADYVWLPIDFSGPTPVIRWLAEWSVDDFD